MKMHHIPDHLIPVSRPSFSEKEKKYVLDCLETGWVSSIGKYIDLFELKFAEYLGVKHAIACSNGTAALHLALIAIGIKPGDEVIVPALTFVATANAVKYTGATPVFAESEPDTGNIDPYKFEKLITPNTKAIIVVPLYGHPCDMDPIMDIAKDHNIWVVEDAAEALGAEYKGRKCGSIADISTFSFYGNKIITTGEGGMVVTNDTELAEKVILHKGQGVDKEKRYWFTVVGYNYRITNIQSAIGLAQIENVEKYLDRRKEIARWYGEHLKGVSGLTHPAEKEYASHSYWMYSVLIENDFGKTRDEVIDYLFENGIETRPFFYPMHTLPVYKQKASHLKQAEDIASKGINLPTYYDLRKDDIDYISGIIRQGCRR